MRSDPMLVLASWLMAGLVSRLDRDAVIGDLAEEYAQVRRQSGTRGTLWLAKQVLLSTPPLLRVRIARALGAARASGNDAANSDSPRNCNQRPALNSSRLGPHRASFATLRGPRLPIEQEIRREQAFALGIAGSQLQEAIEAHAAANACCPAAGSSLDTQGNVSRRVLQLLIQREALGLGCCNLDWVARHYAIPAVVLGHLGWQADQSEAWRGA